MTFPNDGVKKPRGKYWWLTLEKPHRAIIGVASAWATVGSVGLILLLIRQRWLYRDHFSEEKYNQ
jgi:hypothetical protein